MKLQRKNRLTRAGRVKKAGALDVRIGKDLKLDSKNKLKKVDGRMDAKNMWAAVRQLTGRQQETGAVTGITADRVAYQPLCRHFYRQQLHATTKKAVCHPSQSHYISAWRVFHILDYLHVS